MDLKEQIALEFAKFQTEYFRLLEEHQMAYENGSIYLKGGHDISKLTYALQDKHADSIIALIKHPQTSNPIDQLHYELTGED